MVTRTTSMPVNSCRLNTGVFSPDGVLQYNMTTPMSFQSEDKLGVYQPAKDKSIVIVYYRSATATTYELGEQCLHRQLAYLIFQIKVMS